MDLYTFLIMLAFLATLGYLANINNKTAKETASGLIKVFFKDQGPDSETSRPELETSNKKDR